MRIHADIKRPTRFIIGLRARAIQIGAGRRIPRRLRVTGAVVANIEQVIHAAGQAQVLFTSGSAEPDDAVRTHFIQLAAGYRLALIVEALRFLPTIR